MCKMSQRRENLLCAMVIKAGFREEEKVNQALKDRKGLSRYVVGRVRGIMT